MSKRTLLMINVHEDDVLCFRKEVINALADNGYKIVLMYPLGDRYKELLSTNIVAQDVQMDRHGTNPIKDMVLLFKYIKAIKSYNPDALLLYTIKPNIYGSIAARIMRRPYINNITGIGSSIGKKEGIMQKFIYQLYRIALKETSHVFFQNVPNRNYFLEKNLCKPEKTSVIPGSGVDLSRFSYIKLENTEGVIFNYIGRVMKSKGILDYLEAARIIKNEYPNCEFNVLGFIEEDEKDTKEKLLDYDKKGFINYRGNQKDIRPWIIRSSAIIHPSQYGEGISNVLLETAATGRPLITTNIAGCRELVQNKNGFLFEPGDVSQMINQIKAFLSLPQTEKEEMGKRSRELVEQHFSRTFVVDAYLKKVNEIIGLREI